MLARTFDRPTQREIRRSRARYVRASRVEQEYARHLRAIARACGDFVRGLEPETQVDLSEAESTLRRYAALITPWARATAARMVAQVGQKDEKDWKEMGRLMGRALEQEIQTAPTGAAMRRLLEEQVHLITSLPLEAAERVHRLAVESTITSGRAKELAREILNTGEVTESRAMLIARTEIARSRSILTQVRAEHVGSEGYIWRTAKDSDVRDEHRELEGTFHKWSEPPVAGHGKGGVPVHAHAGQIWNCRCWAEPVIPQEFEP